MARPTVIYSLPKVYGTKSCVYKLSFNDKYVIVKAKDHESSVNGIQKSLNQFMRDSELQRKPDNLYFHFFSHVEKEYEGKFVVDIILESDNAYELLKAEQIELDKSVLDKKCLNNTTLAYIPQFNELTGLYGWIKKQSVLNFKKWLKKNPKNK